MSCIEANGIFEVTAITRLAAGEMSTDFKRSFFRSRRVALPKAMMERQSALSLAAFQAFSNRADALSFLNDYNRAIGGRPIDVAGSQSSGLDKALSALQHMLAPAELQKIGAR
jgi:hypothetical protein